MVKNTSRVSFADQQQRQCPRKKCFTFVSN